jgi:hypothetical protein
MVSTMSKLTKLIRHERSARRIGSVAEADVFAAKIAEFRARGIGGRPRKWARKPGERPTEFVFERVLYSQAENRYRAFKQVMEYIAELESRCAELESRCENQRIPRIFLGPETTTKSQEESEP